MPRTIKMGGMDVIIPDDSPLAPASAAGSTPQFQADKPEEPEKLESLPYVYRPNDPFQSSVDRVVALGNVQDTKPWVKKAFLIMFLIFPASLMEITALNALIFEPPGDKLRKFVMYNVVGLVACAPYLMIWIGTKLAKKRSQARASQPSSR